MDSSRHVDVCYATQHMCTSWRALLATAAAQRGYFTSAQAAKHGISRQRTIGLVLPVARESAGLIRAVVVAFECLEPAGLGGDDRDAAAGSPQQFVAIGDADLPA